MEPMKVSDLMSRDVQRCAPDDTLHRAAQLMYERDCGTVAIVGRDGYVHGIVTDRDVCIAAYRTEKNLKDIHVEEVMSKEVKTCSQGTSLHDAERMLRMLRVRRLPVVDDAGTLVGMLSLTDIARAVLGSRDEAEEREVFKTLGAVSLPKDKPAQQPKDVT